VLRLDGIGPLYQQICGAFRDEILSRSLAPGDRVPSTRALADLLKVSRNTAVMAYEQLLAEGYLEARIGAAGTVVVPHLPPRFPSADPSSRPWLQQRALCRGPARLAITGERILKAIPVRTDRRWDLAPPHLPYEFRPGRPAFADVPYSVWCRLLGSRARRASVRDLDYGPPEGSWELRKAIADRLRRLRGIETSPEKIVIVNGPQQALDLISRVLLNPEDRVLIEEPHYDGARWAFLGAGAELITAAVDNDGIKIPKANPGRPIRLAYVTPSHQFPTGVILPVSRRLELLDWASRVKAFVVEDDYDSEYRYDGPPLQALAGLDRDGRVIYVGTFSKILFPALRLGYLVLPESLVEAISAAKAMGDTGTAILQQLALADFMNQGHFDRHLRRTNASNAARRNALVGAVHKEFGERAEVCGANAGLHLFVWFKRKRGQKIEAVARQAEQAGVGLYSADMFYTRPPGRTGVVLGYASLRERDIREGIRRLAAALT